MENAWMPKVAGILDIVAGAFAIIGAFFTSIWSLLIPYFATLPGMDFREFGQFPVRFFAAIAIFVAIFLVALGILAIVGGIFALRKKKWGLALAGSIAALLTGGWLLGIPAIVFTIMGKKLFE